uniref:Uncharacterized protein n=1 Tax=Arundo donax TaxID=35708 RepID=A0A0A9FF93_ARUDO
MTTRTHCRNWTKILQKLISCRRNIKILLVLQLVGAIGGTITSCVNLASHFSPFQATTHLRTQIYLRNPKRTQARTNPRTSGPKIPSCTDVPTKLPTFHSTKYEPIQIDAETIDIPLEIPVLAAAKGLTSS